MGWKFGMDTLLLTYMEVVRVSMFVGIIDGCRVREAELRFFTAWSFLFVVVKCTVGISC